MKSALFYSGLASLISGFLLLAHPLAQAEKADAGKPISIDADASVYDDIKQTTTSTGNVVVTRGTLLMKAGKMILKTDPAGYQFATLLPGPGGFTTFRQRRDGGDFWVDGRAERIEYDNKTDVVKLFSKANLKRLNGTKTTDEMEGEFISYDSRTDVFTVNNTANGDSKPGAGRIKVVIQPRTENQGNP
jgi:lipopolysaccharide export system protein LptA